MHGNWPGQIANPMPIGSAFSLALILSDCFSFDFICTLDTLFAQVFGSIQ